MSCPNCDCKNCNGVAAIITKSMREMTIFAVVVMFSYFLGSIRSDVKAIHNQVVPTATQPSKEKP